MGGCVDGGALGRGEGVLVGLAGGVVVVGRRRGGGEVGGADAAEVGLEG